MLLKILRKEKRNINKNKKASNWFGFQKPSCLHILDLSSFILSKVCDQRNEPVIILRRPWRLSKSDIDGMNNDCDFRLFTIYGNALNAHVSNIKFCT